MKVIAWVTVIGAFLLFQIHSIFAWIEITGHWTGFIWAIVFELSAIFFLVTKNTEVGIGALVFVLCMASFNISKDTRTTFSTGVNDSSIALAEKTLNDIKDKPYPITIQKTMQLIVDLKASNKIEITTSESISLWLGIVLQIAGASVILLAYIKAIIFIRDGYQIKSETEIDGYDDIETNTETPETQNEITDVDSPMALLAKDILSEMVAWGHKNGYRTETTIRDGLGLGSATFSRLRTVAETGSGMRESTMLDIRRRIEHGRKRV